MKNRLAAAPSPPRCPWPKRSKSRPVWRDRLKSFTRWLVGAPLIIAVVGGLFSLLTVWLAPELTRKWQNHQKSLEVKTGLVAKMSDSVTGAVLTAQFIGTGLFAKHVRDPQKKFELIQSGYSHGLREWRISSARIGTQIEAYFSKSLKKAWDRATGSVTDFYRLSSDELVLEERLDVIDDLIKHLRQDHVDDSGVDWTALVRLQKQRPAARAEFRDNYMRLSGKVLAETDSLVERVLRSSPSGL